MKKRMFVFLPAALCAAMCACGHHEAAELKITSVPSSLYSQTDIRAAVDTAVNVFNSGFDGCYLQEIHYAGDTDSAKMQEWAEQYDADEAIILLSSIYTEDSRILTPHTTYDNWNWILVRDKGGQWELKTHGY